MDKYQHWNAYCFKLDDIYKYISSIDPSMLFKNNKSAELYITWCYAKFLQSVNKRDYIIGFPSIIIDDNIVLKDLLHREIVVDDDNFDTVVIDIENIEKYHPIQVKRYKKVRGANTRDLCIFVDSKVKRYSVDKALNFIFFLESDFKLDISTIYKYFRLATYSIGTIFLFAVSAKPILKARMMQIYPADAKGIKCWSPE